MVMRYRPLRVLTRLIALVLCGLLGGVMVAAAAFPAIGLAGLSAKSASDSWEGLPTELKTPVLPQTSNLYAADGSLITRFYDQNRVPVRLQDIPLVMRHAILAAEDSRFYEHNGVDPQGMVRAFVANQNSGEVTQGASTLTQQYVRNVLRYSAKTRAEYRAATERTAARKIREAKHAMALEERLSKDEILERYLDIAYFGNGGYGMGSASQAYFSVPPAKLTLAQSAMLAGMVKSPSVYNPIGRDGAAAKNRRDYILQRMAELKFITQVEADAAKQQPLGLRPAKPTGSCVTGNAALGFYCGWFLDWWKSNPAFGATPQLRERNLRTGGFQIQTALDPRMQAAAQAAADSQTKRTSRYANGIVLIEPGTGRVKAMAITRTYSLAANRYGRDYPNTVNPLLTGSAVSPGYQAGSTFKMFTMVAALRKGLPLNTKIHAPYQYRSIYISESEASCGGKYCPKNASEAMTGLHTMWSGFGESVNTYFVQLEQKATVKLAVKTAEDLGIVFRSPKDQQNKASVQHRPNGDWGSFTLGTAQVTPLDMANAYATVAARGRRCQPIPVLRIVDRDGRPSSAAIPRCRQVIPADVADAAADAARCPVGEPSAGPCTHPGGGPTAASVGRTITRPIAGKTGTTDANRAAWFVGFTPNLAGAAFYVDPDAPNTTSVPNSKVPIEVFKRAMSRSLKYLPRRDFIRPTPQRAYANSVYLDPNPPPDPRPARTKKPKKPGPQPTILPTLPPIPPPTRPPVPRFPSRTPPPPAPDPRTL